MRLDDTTWSAALRRMPPADVLRLYDPPDWLTAMQCGALVVRSGLAHRIVWSVAQDAASAGWTGAPVKLAGRSLSDVMVEAMGAARARGGAWLWPVRRGEGPEQWRQPLKGRREVVAVQVLTRDEVTPREWESDVESPEWGRPRLLSVHPQRDGMSWPGADVHASRLAYVPGLRAWPSQMTPLGYDLSALDLYRSAIESIEQAWGSLSLMLERRAIMWIRLATEQDARTVEGADAADGLRARMDAMATRMRGADPLIWLGTDEDTGWSAPPLSGTQEVLAALVSRACAVEGIPAARLFGTPPGGLSTDDAAGQRSYAALLSRTRAAAQPALERVLAIAGIAHDPIEWAPTEDLSEIERATASEARARRDATLVQAGILAPDEPRTRWEGDTEREQIALMDGLADEPLTDPLADGG